MAVSRTNSLRLVMPVVCLLVAVSPAFVAADEQPQDEQAGLRFVEVPAQRSGLSHVINSDEEKYGKVNWLWMSPLVDIDGDGHLDLLVFGHHGGTGPDGEKALLAERYTPGAAAVWLGRGDGTFRFDDRGYHRRWAFGARDPIWIDLTGNGAMDGIATEFARVSPRVLLNDGSGRWELSSLAVPGMLIDTDGDGRFDGVWHRGELQRMEPPLWQWGKTPPETIEYTTVWNAAEALGQPEGVEPGRFGGWREAYSVDLTGDDRNELVINIQGPGFHTQQLVSFVLTRAKRSDGEETWQNTTAARGLPTGVGHCLYPEDVDVDGHLDLVDVETGFWYRNDGQGQFTQSPYRLFDPETRQIGRRVGVRPWSPDNDLQWIDLTNNGSRDLVTGTAHHSGMVSGGVFLNLGGGRFVEADGLPTHYCRGRKFADVDGDHRIDMVHNDKGQMVLHRNQTPNHGMHVKLVPRGHAEAHLGAKLWVYQAGKLGDRQALVHYSQGFVPQRSNRSNVLSPDLHVGLGQAEAVDVRVRFPSGTVREVRGVKAGTRVAVHEAE